MDEINVSADEFGKSILSAVVGVAREELPITGSRGVAHSQEYIAAGSRNPTRNFFSFEGQGEASSGRKR